MERKLNDYTGIVGKDVVERIRERAKKLEGLSMVHINSTAYGGGVAEMLRILVPLLNDVRITTHWKVLDGIPEFFEITKKIHNALQGNSSVNLTEEEKKVYLEINRKFSEKNKLDYDIVVVHDPQPAGIVNFYEKKQPWIWRCHIDLSNPNPSVWEFVGEFVAKYDLAIISNEEYARKDFPTPYRIIHPAIDPLSDKNRDTSMEEAERILEKQEIPLDKPYILQVSRFDPWKDPRGVIKIFRKVREKIPVRLVMCGNMAHDDPEGERIYKEIRKETEDLWKSGDLIFVVNADDLTVNALQRKASVVIQKSIKEGFGLTVTEAMWKERAVVASRVGGIKIQIEDGKSGFLVDPYDIDGFAAITLKLLRDRELAERIGKNARERVKRNFLITRLLEDYLKIVDELRG